MVFKLKLFILIVLILSIIGCGGNSSSIDKNKEPTVVNTVVENNTVSDTRVTDTVTDNNKIVGYLIDAPIVNMAYQCGEVIGTTGVDGKFECSIMPVEFKVGNLVIGSISEITIDGKIYPQDLVGVDRDDISNPEVLRIASFLQSLDDDGDLTTAINIPNDIAITASGNLADMTQEETDALLRESGIIPVSLADAEEHLRANLGIEAEVTDLSSGTTETGRAITSGGTTRSDSGRSGGGRSDGGRSGGTVLQAPLIANTSAVVAIQNTAINNIIFTNTGGTIASCTVSPTLPIGLSIANDCTIFGTPTAVTAQATYTVTATNVTGSDTATVDITVNAPLAPNIADTTAPISVKDIAIANITFTNTGGAITSCTVLPALPTGLSIANDCTISGTPTVVTDQATYTVTATNVTGSDTATVDITVSATLPAPVVANASDVIAINGTAITDIVFSNTGGAISSCSVTPSLPIGLHVEANSDTCKITGIPTAETAQSTYTITGTNATGNDTATVNITVNPKAPIVVNASAVVAVNGIAITDISFTNTGGAIDSCTVLPALPTGLSIANDCTISGTPTAVIAQATYTVTATNVTGNDTATVDITVNPKAPIVANVSEKTYPKNSAITALIFTNTGGAVTSCTVSPNLPIGLSVGVNNDTCEITGTPTAITTQDTYTVTATNVSGSDTATVDITISDKVPNLADISTQSYSKDTAITALAFTNTGGAVTSCSVSPNLPTGLSVGVNNNTCEITGTPTEVTTQKTYTITGTNATGNDTATVDIIISDAIPSLADATAQTYPKDTAITALAFTNTGGAVTSCSVSPNLPTGLSVGVNNDTCEITGTPTEVTTQKTYTITGTNATGNDTATVDITITNDSDNDYIPNDIEILLGMNPNNADEDGDGILDGLQLSGDKGDDFFDKQWHIRSTGANSSPYSDSTTVAGNDLGVMNIYHAYMGYNGGTPLVIQVVDTGVDANHEDLIDNMDLSLSRNSNTKAMGDPAETANSSHGTMCAGIIGARAFNGKGVRGIAPFAKIAGSNWLSYKSIAELEEAWTKNDSDGKIILASNSWGTESALPSTYFEDLMEYAANNLRKVGGIAKGKLFIKAAGNGRRSHHDSGLAYIASNPYVITVAGLKSDNTYASYSSPGTNILVSGYSGDFFQNSATIGTTYIAGRSALAGELSWDDTKKCLIRSGDNECSMPTWGADNSANKSYTYGMNGTSAATPTVAGSLALVLEACPTLPWRDVKYLIAKNAIQIDSSNGSWVTNSAGLHHSVDYGFGLINPSGMINECKNNYTELPASSSFSENFDPEPDIAIPDNDTTGISYNFTVSGNKIIEWIGVTVTSNHSWGGDLEIYLTSPAGTTTRLMMGNNSGRNYSLSGGFRYGSVAFMGESTVGTWTIKIADIGDEDSGNLESLIFTVFGH